MKSYRPLCSWSRNSNNISWVYLFGILRIIKVVLWSRPFEMASKLTWNLSFPLGLGCAVKRFWGGEKGTGEEDLEELGEEAEEVLERGVASCEFAFGMIESMASKLCSSFSFNPKQYPASFQDVEPLINATLMLGSLYWILIEKQ